jgi:hypothetical protein
MKKLIFVLFFILYAIILSAQSFYKGALVADASVGIEIYDTKYTYKLKNSNLDTTLNDKAGNRNFSIGAEYGVINRLGVGLRFKSNNYFVSKDKTSGITPYVSSYDYMLTVNFHPIVNNVFNLVTGINFGGSHLNYVSNDINNNRIYGNGTYFDLHVTPRIYIKSFAFEFNISAPFVSYNNMTSNNPDFNTYVIAKWKGSGYNIGMGIAYRFIKKKEDSKKSVN